MKRLVVLVVLASATGCSNAPIAGFLDYCFPSKCSDTKPPERPRDSLPPADTITPLDLGTPVGPPVTPTTPVAPTNPLVPSAGPKN
jgi:hypothetical protein